MPVESIYRYALAETALKGALADGLEAAAHHELGKIEDGFSSGTDALGRPWAPLAESTIRQKGFAKILIMSGDLANSGYVKRDGTTVYLGMGSPLTAIHEFGTRTIPPRQILTPAKIDLEDGVIYSALVNEIGNAIAQLAIGAALGRLKL